VPHRTLVLFGARDRLIPARLGARLAEHLPDARLVVLEDCGHLVQLEYPDVVNDAIRRLVDRALADAGRAR
jgi:pimeloyl-ACP methyl ester carboxylesterase